MGQKSSKTTNKNCADKIATAFISSMQVIPGSFNCFDDPLKKKLSSEGINNDSDLMVVAKGNSQLFDVTSCGPLLGFNDKYMLAAYQLYVYSNPRVFILLILVINRSNSKVTYYEFYTYLPCTSEYSVTVGV